MQEVTGSSPVSPTIHRFRTQDVHLPIVADVMTGGSRSAGRWAISDSFSRELITGGWSTSGRLGSMQLNLPSPDRSNREPLLLCG